MPHNCIHLRAARLLSRRTKVSGLLPPSFSLMLGFVMSRLKQLVIETNGIRNMKVHVQVHGGGLTMTLQGRGFLLHCSNWLKAIHLITCYIKERQFPLDGTEVKWFLRAGWLLESAASGAREQVWIPPRHSIAVWPQSTYTCFLIRHRHILLPSS